MKKKDVKKNNKKGIIIGIVVLLVVIILGVIIFTRKNDNQPLVMNDDFVYLGEYSRFSEIPEDEYLVFSNYSEFSEKISDAENNVLNEEDFASNNYVLIPITYDSCSEYDITPTEYEINGNNIIVTIKYRAECGLCAPGTLYYLLRVDKNITNPNVKIEYKRVNKPHCDPNVSYKPIIYMYPKDVTPVSVKLGYPHKLTTTYPKYNDGWNVVAYPNGDLKDEKNTYYGLYWEGLNEINTTFEDGFVVSSEDTISFLEEKLSILGLNERERNEFIIYWLPILEKNKYNLIRFETLDIINKEMPLDITPKPDTLIRVLMEYKSINKEIEIKEQKLSTPERNGFTVVEWGGTLIK